MHSTSMSVRLAIQPGSGWRDVIPVVLSCRGLTLPIPFSPSSLELDSPSARCCSEASHAIPSTLTHSQHLQESIHGYTLSHGCRALCTSIAKRGAVLVASRIIRQSHELQTFFIPSTRDINPAGLFGHYLCKVPQQASLAIPGAPLPRQTMW